eukprot:jgi/Tetstr1/447828/TSEL_035156.t1
MSIVSAAAPAAGPLAAPQAWSRGTDLRLCLSREGIGRGARLKHRDRVSRSLCCRRQHCRTSHAVHSTAAGDGDRPWKLWKDLLGDSLSAPPAGDLHIRPAQLEEWPDVADIQAISFHIPSKLAMMNTVAFNNFRAEVRATLSQKLKYADMDRFCCLVAESKSDAKLVGVVEVSLLNEKEVLMRLDAPAASYAYIACMAVDPDRRRDGVASALLAAAEQVAVRWKQGVAVLDVYEDNVPARKLYEANGYSAKKFDPDWVKVVGRRKRLHMDKLLAPL